MTDKANIETEKLLSDLEDDLNESYDNTNKEILRSSRQYIEKIYLDDDEATEQKRISHAKRNGLSFLVAMVTGYIISINEKNVIKITNAMDSVTDINYTYWQEIFIQRTGININAANRSIPYVVKKYGRRAYNRLQQEKYVSRHVLKEIRKGVKAGENTRKIAARIQKVSNKSRNSAVTTARTETTRIMNQSRMEAFQDAERLGIRIKKRWTHSGIPKHPRHWHESMSGELVNVNEKFSNGLMQPGEAGAPASEVINCRCFVTAEFY